MAKAKSRWAWLAAGTLVLLPILSACGGEAAPTATTAPAAPTNTTAAMGETPTTGTGGEATATTGTGTGTTLNYIEALAEEGIKEDPSATGKLEFFSWWTAGGEAEGKNDILALYKQLYPNVEVIDAAIAGGGGDQAKAVLKTRMQGGDPLTPSRCMVGPS